MSDGAAGPWAGGRVAPLARCVLAPNPGPMTLDGTNTWLLGAPGAGGCVVVDPGPDDAAHRAAVRGAAAEHGGVALVLLTHHHLDHSAGARAVAAAASREGAPVVVRAADPALCRSPDGAAPAPLVDGEVVAVPGGRLHVLGTPGHTRDSVCLLLEADAGGEPLLLTGDTVLGRGTSVVAHPDGDLAAYLASLGRLAEEVSEAQVRRLLPGHGPVRDEALDVLVGYLAHRRERLAQVRAAVAAGARTAEEVVAAVYPGLADDLVAPAVRSTAAALAVVAADGPPGGGGVSAPGG